MGRQFKRVLSLQLIKPSIATNAFFVQLPNAVTITQMEVKFKIEKSLSKKPNKASVTIMNLAESTRAQIEKVPLIVQLSVGYEDDPDLQRVFSGDLRIGDTTRQGPLVATQLEMGDGDRAYQFGHVSRSFGQGAKVVDAVIECAKGMGIGLPPGIAGAPGMQNRYPCGITLHGPAQTQMSKILTPVGQSWSLQDGQLVILTDRQPREGEAILINQASGMVGSPKLGPPKKPGETPSLKVRKLIDSRIVAGCKIKMDARDVKGLFRVEKLAHSGDFRGKDWYTDIDARQL